MKTNIKLLSAIRERGFRQVDFAKVVGDHHTFISRVINGWINLELGTKSSPVAELNLIMIYSTAGLSSPQPVLGTADLFSGKLRVCAQD